MGNIIDVLIVISDVLISGRDGICGRDERLSNHCGSLGYSDIKTVRKLYLSNDFNLMRQVFFIVNMHFCSQSDVELGSMQLLIGSY